MPNNATKGPSVKEQELMATIFGFKYDPLAYVMYAFPWGVKGTPLERYPGPREWQVEEFEKIRKHIESNVTRTMIGLQPEVYYLAISSGRGIGKSAFLNMLDMWVASCWPGVTSITTANTETQLRSRTMAELGKWHTMAINRHWFEKSSMALRPASWFARLIEDQLGVDTQYYYVEGQSWSEENPDAFAGAHNTVAMVVKFDEASGIPNPIWDVTEGFFTDMALLRIWVAISNPRRNTGRFFDCFHDDSEFWETRHIDSRTVEGVDATVYQRIADKYGEDHDTTRVEVKGQFPRVGSNQFIGREVVSDAAIREVEHDEGAPLIMSLDVARYGDDESICRFRKGRDARSYPRHAWRGLSTMQLATEAALLIDEHHPDAVFVDGGGVGAGVVDRLRQLGYKIIEVQYGGGANNKEKYLNKRAEMWGEMRDWLVYGAIDDDDDLITDLTNPEYKVTDKGQIKIESKDDMKKRGLDSPDDGDALAQTFAEPVSRNDFGHKKRSMMLYADADTEYDMFNT